MHGAYSSRRNVLFDLDGTLADSAPAHARAFVAALLPTQPEMARHFDYAAVAGMTTRDAFLQCGLEGGPELSDLVRKKRDFYRAALARGEVSVFPGAEALLRRLHAEGRRLILVTGASRLSAERLLGGMKLATYLEAMVTAEDVPRGKPAPDPYRHALIHHALRADDSVAIEDGAHGIESARRAGLEVVAIHGAAGFADAPHARNFEELERMLCA